MRFSFFRSGDLIFCGGLAASLVLLHLQTNKVIYTIYIVVEMVSMEYFSTRSEVKILCLCCYGDMGGMTLATLGSPSLVCECRYSMFLLLPLVLCSLVVFASVKSIKWQFCFNYCHFRKIFVH